MTLFANPLMMRRWMDERGVLHRIEDDLAEGWVDDWAGEGIGAIEGYLAKHLAFLSYLEEGPDLSPTPPTK